MISSLKNKGARPGGFALILALGAAALAPAVPAATTEVNRDDAFEDLQQGELDGVALSSDGYLYPSYARTQLGDTGAEIIWDALDLGDKGVLCVTGHDGKLIRLNDQGQTAVLGDVPEPELTAICPLRDGSALIGAAPSGRIYRLDSSDKLTTFTQLQAKFVWDMQLDDAGAVWAATGPHGALFKITFNEAGIEAKQVHSFNSRNITDLWVDRAGKMGDPGMIYVAGQDPGWLYRFNPSSSEVTVLFDSGHDEIRAIQPSADGLLLAVNTDRSPTPQALTMTMRLSGAPAQAGSGASSSSSSSSSASGSGGGGGERDLGDVFKGSKKSPGGGPSSAVILLTVDGYSRTVWQSPERPIHSITINGAGNPLVAAGGKGRIFEILPRDAFALVADLREDFVTKIIASTSSQGGWLLACARNGVVSRMLDKRAEKAVYRSKAIDGGGPAKWGMFYFTGESGQGAKVSVAFRKGSTDQPEVGGWQHWSDEIPLDANSSAQVPGPVARYTQYRLTFESPADSGAPLRADYTELFYQRPNYAPKFRSVIVNDGAAARLLAQSGEGGAGKPPAPSSSGGSSGSPQGSTPSGPMPEDIQGGGRAPDSNSKNLVVSWSVEDPNLDKLIYALYYKAENETVWKLIQDELRGPRMNLGVGVVGDGRYRFRVVATDALDNPPGAGLESEMVSDEVVIDNSPPMVDGLTVTPQGDRAQVKLTVRDSLSLISSIQAEIDGEDSYPIFPADGLYDQSVEQVDWSTLKLEPGEHVITISATDRRGNTVVQRAVFNIAKP